MRSQLRHSTPITIGGRTKPVLAAEYVVGLTDGEGCFYVNIKKSSAYRSGAGIQLQFHIKLNERDRELLEAVREMLIGKIIPFFRRYPLQSASKLLSFEIFCKIAYLVEQGRHLTEDGIKEIALLKTKMNQKTGLA